MRAVTIGLAAATLGLAGCGGGDGDKGASSGGGDTSSGSSSASKAPALGPEATLRAYFTALNAGEAKTICDLEDDTLEQFKYDATGAACLNEEANKMAQPALPSGAQITIAQKKVTADAANYTVLDQKGASISAQLVKADGRWLMHVFT